MSSWVLVGATSLVTTSPSDSVYEMPSVGMSSPTASLPSPPSLPVPPSPPAPPSLPSPPWIPPSGPAPFNPLEAGPLFLLGVSLAVVGNTLIACSLTLQKYCVNKEVETGVKTSAMPLFWLALAGMIGGEVGNFTAFGFASQTVVSPLGAFSVIVNTILASIFLGETITCQTIVGIVLTLGGSVAVVLFSPPPLGSLTCDTFIKDLGNPYAYGYLIVLCLATVALYLLEPRYGSRIVLVNVGLCSLLGSVTVICSTAVSKFLRVAVNGDISCLATPVPYLLVPTLVATAVTQLRFLNKAMEHFPSAVVVPTYYVSFTLCSIAGGVWVFDESWRPKTWLTPVPNEEYYFFIGCIFCFGGVFCIAYKKGSPTQIDPHSGAGSCGPASAASAPQRDSELRATHERTQTHDDEQPQLRQLGRAATFSGRAATFSWHRRRRTGRSTSSLPPAATRAHSTGDLPQLLLNDDADDFRTISGTINVVTGVGTLSQLAIYFSSRESTSGDPLGGLPVDGAPQLSMSAATGDRTPPVEEGLAASLIRNERARS